MVRARNHFRLEREATDAELDVQLGRAYHRLESIYCADDYLLARYDDIVNRRPGVQFLR
ncbi:hypothetical protein HMF8227_00178 [Saliniradius amylolyticus]|uniref:Uncharacterized protein n=1 Tax=Saliniradius amylolyticus TaxID=2183582 RepID=A0A2S2DZ79_9ALTE|nr:hypothetical protein HMF8227_00178 [Saliniradius amylolyticus]